MRPSPGDRSKSVVELKGGETLLITGYYFDKNESVLWWKVTEGTGMTGWIINNPQYITIDYVQFDAAKMPTNVSFVKP